MALQRIKILLTVFFSIQYCLAQEQSKIEKRSYTTKSLENNKAPIIDGILTDSSWDIVDWQTDFIENLPDENTAPTEQTKFKILYDAKFLYVAFKCYDKEPEKIVKRLSRRDGFDGDFVEVNIDSYHDKRTGFSFTISASGVKSDEFIADNGNNWDASWNPIWYVKTNIDSEGWTAEMKIPLSQLKFSAGKDQIWGFQATRRYFRKQERSVWQRIPADAPGWVSEFGNLEGLANLKPQKQLEIQPYFLTQLDTYEQENGNPFRDGEDLTLNAGLDAKIGVTNDLTLDLTINPDFGQVEADPAVIALDGFQIFLQERRPFFIENKNIFDCNFGNNEDNLFYSRRIGRSPQGIITTQKEDFIKRPQNTTILGAAKFSGKTKNGWSLGIMESVTADEYVKIDNGQERQEVHVEPLTNYFVGRVQKDFNGRNSFLGAILTATSRNTDEPQFLLLRKAAYTGGLDFKHNWKNRKYFIGGNVISSHVLGSRESITNTQKEISHLFQRADADYVSVDESRTSLTGTGGKIEAGKAAEGHWRYNATLTWRSPELELNDIGFLRQADEIKQTFYVSYQSLKPFGIFRSGMVRLEPFVTYDFGGFHNRTYYDLLGKSEFKNYWWANIGFSYKPRIYNNAYLQGGPKFRFSEEFVSYNTFGSDPRKKLRFQAGVFFAQGKNNSFSYKAIDPSVTYQPTNALSITLNPNFNVNQSKTQYVTQSNYENGIRYITSHLEQQTLSASLRLNYSINPNFTIQYYGQPFVSTGKYSDFNYVTNPRAAYFADRVVTYNQKQISFDSATNIYNVDENQNGTNDYSFRNPDFSFVQFRSNLVLRWEYIPGSEIYLVWSQGTNGSGNPMDDLFVNLDTQILGKQPQNTFIFKMTYRFLL
ncbi:putative membrane associated hydrolase [Flavobacterium anhuiense]|uniref:Putative membrane associated hydrolase n=1 Tax=Flavobacterium anhuiense TaxID=459526 RepID=A0A444VZ48_9FLAO|nr:DUF5916 domain-containing protein [Flavobacterium anhuiense]RYJ38885.1 putative membrane associated hydrolase [Flavobacterium anhuiense]